MLKSHQLWITDIILVVSANVINSIIVCFLFITLVRLLFKDKLLPAELTSNLTSLMMTIEALHLAVKLIIFCLLPQVLSSMFINSVIHIWIITIIQWRYMSAEIEHTPRHLLEGYYEVAVADDKATTASNNHNIEHWAAALSLVAVSVYPVSAVIFYYGSEWTKMLSSNANSTAVATGLVLGFIQLAVIWISACKLEPHLRYAAGICQTVRESIAFKNEAGIFDWIQALFRYRKITQTDESERERNTNKNKIN